MGLRATFAGRTDVGRVRTRNEDTLVIDPEHALAVVADGMGGHPGGDVASRVAAEAAANSLRAHIGAGGATASPGDNLDDAMGEAMVRCVLDAHRAVRSEGRNHPELRGMGTTLTALVVDPSRARWAVGHAGDSRAYLLRDGRLRQVSRDDTWVQAQVDAGRITSEEARHHPAAHVLRQCVGLDDPPEPRSYAGELEAGDRILLCSDGLSDMVEDEGILRILVDAPDPQDAVAALVDAALEEGGVDNVTVALAAVDDA